MPKSIDDLLKEYEAQESASVPNTNTAYDGCDGECCGLTCCLACVSI